MSKLFLTIIVLLSVILSIVPARAVTYKLPTDKPVVAITVPDAWKPEKIDKGVQAQTADNTVYVAAETTRSEQGMNAIIDDTLAMLKTHKVSFKGGGRKENKYDLNGLSADEIQYDGRDEDGPATVSITFIKIGTGTVLVLTYWASPASQKEHSEEIKAVVGSIKAIK